MPGSRSYPFSLILIAFKWGVMCDEMSHLKNAIEELVLYMGL